MTDETKTVPSPVADWVAGRRAPIGYALLALGVVFVGLGVAFGFKAFSGAGTAEGKDSKLEVVEPKGKGAEKDKAVIDPDRGDYAAPSFWACAVGVTLLGLGMWWLSREDSGREAAIQARRLVLTAGGLFGLFTAVLGLLLAYRWHDSLLKWLNNNQVREARWVVFALLVYFVGLTVMFFSMQPARSEERNSPGLRRLIYGFNTVLAGLLLLLLLSVGNVVAGVKLPNILDTTEAKFFSLSDTSKQFLGELRQPVKAYLIMQRGDLFFADMKALLTNCEDASPNFHAVYLSPGLDKAEINRLYKRVNLPEGQRDQLGLVLAVGEDEKQVSFIPENDFFETDFVLGREVIKGFQAEAKMMTELSFLAEGRTKPVIYFTQGSGELDVGNALGAGAGGDRTARELREYLTQRHFEVKTLNIEPGSPPKLDDATAVIVLGPNQPLSKATVDVLRNYARPGQSGGKGGKLLALLPPFPDKNGRDIAKTGLEELLGQFDVRLEPEVLMTDPRETQVSTIVDLAAPGSLTNSQNPIASAVRGRLLSSINVRGVHAGENTTGRGGITFENLLVTNGRSFIWHETTWGVDEVNAFKEMLSDRKLLQAKRLNRQNIPVAVLGTESGSSAGPDQPPTPHPRLAVFGTSDFMADQFLRIPSIDREANLALFTATLDWLRERPSNIGIKPRELKNYRLEKDVSSARIFWMPVMLVCLAIVALGAGVWIVRRA